MSKRLFGLRPLHGHGSSMTRNGLSHIDHSARDERNITKLDLMRDTRNEGRGKSPRSWLTAPPSDCALTRPHNAKFVRASVRRRR